MRHVLLLAFALCLFACGSSDPNAPDNDDGELSDAQKKERREALQGEWIGTWEGTLSNAQGFTLRLEYVAPGTTPACGTVELGSGVGIACATDYQLRVRATVTTADGAYTDQVVDGAISFGQMNLQLPNDGALSLEEGDAPKKGSWRYGGAEGTLTASKR